MKRPNTGRGGGNAAAGRRHVVAGLLVRSLLSYGSHACGIFAAAIAFFGVLSIFPLLLLLISIFTLVVKESEATSIVLSNLSAFFPGSSDLLVSAVDAVTPAEPTFAGLGVAGLLWSSMGVFMTLGYALNRVWNVRRDRNIFVQYAISAGLALSVGLVALVSLSLSAIVDLSHFVRGALPGLDIPSMSWVALAASNAVTFVIVVAVVALLYRWLPSTIVQWREVLMPSIAVALLGTSAKFGFAWYLSTVAHFNRIYGPVAAVAGLMLWMFVAGVLLLFGAELSCQLATLRGAEDLDRLDNL
jgi:membrane protein